MKKRNKVLVIGWDAADWKVINPLMDSGKMPTLEKFINEGVMGNITTLEPVLSPMLWSSIATGKYADKHGILGFTEPDPSTGSVRPVSVTSRKAKAMWNILTQVDKKTNLVGWWPSHPAEPINGVCVSNHYQRASKPLDQEWPMVKGSVYPEELEEKLKWLRIHPGELTEAHIKPFIPKAAEIDQEKDKRLVSFSKILADTSTIQASATYIMENTDWDFMGVYFDGIDHFCHGFMKFHPPQLPGIPDKEFELYQNVVSGGYLFHDMMLDRLLQLAGDDTTVILLSDHGFHSDHLRPMALPKEPAGPAYEHRDHGIICMRGPNIKKDEILYGASLLDIAPTVLNIFGLPIGEDMDGKVLSQAFEKEQKIETIKSWEEVEGDAGMHPKDMQEDPILAKEALDQLVELGYIDKPDENKEIASKKSIRELDYNLVRVYISTERHKEAIPILEKLVKNDPNETRFLIRLGKCYQQTKEYDKARDLLEKTRNASIEGAKKRVEAKKEKAKKEKKTLDKKELIPRTNFPTLDLFEASILIDENKPKKALIILEKITEVSDMLPEKNLFLGRCFLLLKKWEEAEKAFKNVLRIDSNHISANHGLAVSYLRQKKYYESIEVSLTTVGLAHNFGIAHFHLGEALFYVKEYESATQAFELCLKLNPHIGKARNYLIEIYDNHLKSNPNNTLINKLDTFNPTSKLKNEQITEQKKLIKQKALGTITVVSGLPRSGTSMMMQMLEKGGLDIFTDNVRTANESNPKGYYEHQAVKGLLINSKWLKDVGKKAVKVISHLLFNLPPRYHYKVIFMVRDMDEILLSQHKMLAKEGIIKPNEYRTSLANNYKKNIEKVRKWEKKSHHVDIIYISYTDVLEDPLKQSKIVSQFLGEELNLKNMSSVTDKKLYRNKLTS